MFLKLNALYNILSLKLIIDSIFSEFVYLENTKNISKQLALCFLMNVQVKTCKFKLLLCFNSAHILSQ